MGVLARVSVVFLGLFSCVVNASFEFPFREKCRSSYENIGFKGQTHKDSLLVERVLCEPGYAASLSADQIQHILNLEEIGDEIYIAAALWDASKSNTSKRPLLITSIRGKPYMKQPYPRAEKGRRETQADLMTDILPFISKDASFYNRLEKLLFVALSDTASAIAYFTRFPDKYAGWSGDTHLKMSRIQTLLSGNKNKLAFEGLGEVNLGEKASLGMKCKARYFKLKALRKMRQYDAAHQEVNPILTACPEPWRIKAHFLGGLLQHIRPQKNAETIFEGFQKRYPAHSYADDVYYWHARYFRLGDPSKYASMLQEILEKYPAGDQYVQVSMERAFLKLQQGKQKEGLGILDKLTRYPHLKILEKDMADYWYARAQVQPNPLRIQPDSQGEVSSVENGKTLLKKIGRERPTSYYGVLATSYLNILGVSALKKAPPKSEYPSLQNELAKIREVPPIKISEIMNLAQLGLNVSAKLKFDALYASENFQTRVRKIYLAEVARDLEDFARSHQILRSLGMAQLRGAPDFSPHSLWALGYPRGYDVLIKKETEKRQIPRQLLEGLIREESQFEPRALSWAGAYGLCQFMPATALEVARYVGRKNFDIEEIFEPAVSIEFGAAHLGWLIKQIEHPFLAIASYNAGIGNVRRTLKDFTSSEIPIDYVVEKLSNEQTRNYVKRVSSSWAYYAMADGQMLGKDISLQIKSPLNKASPK